MIPVRAHVTGPYRCGMLPYVPGCGWVRVRDRQRIVALGTGWGCPALVLPCPSCGLVSHLAEGMNIRRAWRMAREAAAIIDPGVDDLFAQQQIGREVWASYAPRLWRVPCECWGWLLSGPSVLVDEGWDRDAMCALRWCGALS